MGVIETRKGKNGSNVYRVKIRLKGLPTLSKTFGRKTDANAWAQDTESDLRKKQNFGASAHLQDPLSKLIDRYIELEIPKKKTNQGTSLTHLHWWREAIGDYKIADITPSLLAECRDKLLLQDYAPHKFRPGTKLQKKKSATTVIAYMNALSHAFTIASQEWEWITTNPMTLVRKPEKPQPRVRFLDDDDELARLLKACQQSSCAYLYPIVLIALSTGARYSEVMGLRWRDIDFERNIARLDKTKNKDRRAIPLTHLAMELVQQRYLKINPAKTDLLFPRADGLAPMIIKKHWQKALEVAQIEDFRFHDLRHCAASYLAMNGATLVEIADVSGHKTLQMVKRYAHISDQHTASVVERMNRKMFGTVSNDNEEPEVQKPVLKTVE